VTFNLNARLTIDPGGFMFIVHFAAVIGLLALSWLSISFFCMSLLELYLFAIIALAATLYTIPAYPGHVLLITFTAVACVVTAWVRSWILELRYGFFVPLWVAAIFALCMIIVKIVAIGD
jgi:hypothetical protein